jgi:hypothetical protein
MVQLNVAPDTNETKAHQYLESKAGQQRKPREEIFKKDRQLTHKLESRVDPAR